jgi:hypothetical protein
MRHARVVRFLIAVGHSKTSAVRKLEMNLRRRRRVTGLQSRGPGKFHPVCVVTGAAATHRTVVAWQLIKL